MEQKRRGSLEQDRDLINRLKRMEGQIRGIQRMVEEDQYCVDILNQIAAVKGALDTLSLKILKKHTQGCVKSALEGQEDEREIIEELIAVIHRLL